MVLGETKITDSSIATTETGYRCEHVASSYLHFMLHIVWSIIVGFIVGLIASAIMHTHLGFVGTTLLGIVGSVIGWFDCATVLKTTGGFKISSRWISPVHHRCNCSRLSCETHRLREFLELLIVIQP
jgi:uncharacterized membrane protein YeaQ/YmgE (transglycosylase-associated protein family)